MSYPSIESLLKKYSIHPRKGLGQNFLIAKPTAQKICGFLFLSEKIRILEIGPGLGVLTHILVEKTKEVIAIEKDTNMANILTTELGCYPNLNIINKDFLKIDLKTIINQPIQVVGNIPYNITSPIIFKLIENKSLIKKALLTVQKEVADRIAAKPGNKDYGILSIMVQTNCKTKKLFNMSPSSFLPQPRVISSVIELDFENAPRFDISNYEYFVFIVKSAFNKRRKTLKNSLLHIKEIDEALKIAKINPSIRPEALRIEDFINLSNIAYSIKP